MAARDDTLTATGIDPHSEPPLLYKLRLVYAGSAGITPPRTWTWDGTRPLHVGRSGSGTDGVRIDDERVSREHALLRAREGEIFVEDLKSKNGSSRNGEPLTASAPRRIRDGDVLRVGDSFLIFRHEPPEVEDAAVPTLLGVSSGARAIRAAIARASASDRPVLIVGETGTGKEVVAQALHTLGQKRGRLVAVNCAAIPATLAESQLFGVRRGAFTGASDQPGSFLDASAGTLFLDELGELPLELQPKLLRVLETREVTPVGSSRSVPSDARVVAATNRDLEDAIARKAFRADLYARLTAVPIRLPPLRERREDVLLLAQHFGGPALRPTPRLAAALLLHDWPLNIREVKNVVGRLLDERSEAAILRELPVRMAAATPPPVAAPSPVPVPPAAPADAGPVPPWVTGDAIPSREQVISLLRQHRGNLHAIERTYGCSRRNFRRWAEEKYGLDITQFRPGGPGARED